MKKTALIMAGGRGERFWPRSRKTLPKQFLSLSENGKTMIQLTVERICHLVDIEDVFIATNEAYRSLIQQQLPDIPSENILCEPVGRNTAPCIGLGAIHVAKKYPDAIMFVLPSDHLIKNEEQFIQVMESGYQVALQEENLVTIGIQPNYPETGYGYIKFDPSRTLGAAYEVDQFVEKPNREFAEKYLESGDYLWNSGMFIWKVSSILRAFHTYLPSMYQGLQKIKNALGTCQEQEVLHQVFPLLESISIDYGLMEKASHIYVIPGAFGWDDVGSWLAMERIKQPDSDQNTITGNAIALNSKNCIIEAAEKRLIVALGLENLVVVDTSDATLICKRDSLGDIRKVLETLDAKNMREFL